VDISNLFVVFCGLVLETKSFIDTVTRISMLFVYDGGVECLELDLFYLLVAYWINHIFWI
jgi:hypothetical protein